MHLANDRETAVKKSEEDEIVYLFPQQRRNIYAIFKAIEDIIRNKVNQINYKRVSTFGSKRNTKLNEKY